jgi:hypothetical protein
VIAEQPHVVSSVRHAGRATVIVSGPLSRPGIARLRTELAAWREAGVVDLVVDVSRMPRCDAELAHPLARALAWARAQLRGRGGNLTVTGARAHLRAELADAVEALEGSRPSPAGRPFASSPDPDPLGDPAHRVGPAPRQSEWWEQNR